ncbi:MAG TPA: sodium:calcium antiporter, partial [Patescibacteria group bacterium]
MSLLLWILIFIVALAVLILAADFFTKHSEKVGMALGVPSFIIGVTIVSIGT